MDLSVYLLCEVLLSPPLQDGNAILIAFTGTFPLVLTGSIDAARKCKHNDHSTIREVEGIGQAIFLSLVHMYSD